MFFSRTLKMNHGIKHAVDGRNPAPPLKRLDSPCKYPQTMASAMVSFRGAVMISRPSRSLGSHHDGQRHAASSRVVV